MRLVPLKHLVSINRVTLDEQTDPDLAFRYIDIGSVGRGILLAEPDTIIFAAAPSRARRVVRPDDTLLSTVRTYLRASLFLPYLDELTVASTGFAVLTPGPHIDPRYLGWLVQSDPFVEQIVARSVGVSYPAISPLEIGSVAVPAPAVEEQRAIADFLDAETARIDALVEKRRKQLALLDEHRDALITAAVTGGPRLQR